MATAMTAVDGHQVKQVSIVRANLAPKIDRHTLDVAEPCAKVWFSWTLAASRQSGVTWSNNGIARPSQRFNGWVEICYSIAGLTVNPFLIGRRQSSVRASIGLDEVQAAKENHIMDHSKRPLVWRTRTSTYASERS